MPNYYVEAIEKFRKNRRWSEAQGFGLPVDQLDTYTEAHNGIAHVRRAREASESWDSALTYYCSPGVAPLVIGGYFWLTDIHRMNDTSELLFAVEQLESGLGRMVRQRGSHDDVLGAIVDAARYWLGNSHEWENTRRYGHNLMTGMCFSAHRDDVQMWDRYGDKGRGAAIQFNRHALQTVIWSSATFNSNNHSWGAGLAKVCYGAPTCKCLDQLHEDATKLLPTLTTRAERQLLYYIILSDVLYYLVSHKHPGYKSECEYRWFSLVTTNNTWGGPNAWSLFEKNGRRFHYKKVCWQMFCIGSTPEQFPKELFRDIELGPCSSEDCKREIADVSNMKGIGDRIRRSSLPMRCT